MRNNEWKDLIEVNPGKTLLTQTLTGIFGSKKIDELPIMYLHPKTLSFAAKFGYVESSREIKLKINSSKFKVQLYRKMIGMDIDSSALSLDQNLLLGFIGDIQSDSRSKKKTPEPIDIDSDIDVFYWHLMVFRLQSSCTSNDKKLSELCRNDLHLCQLEYCNILKITNKKHQFLSLDTFLKKRVFYKSSSIYLKELFRRAFDRFFFLCINSEYITALYDHIDMVIDFDPVCPRLLEMISDFYMIEECKEKHEKYKILSIENCSISNIGMGDL